ncbi:MAG: amino-acid N-acetyltransferase [Gammaproteobacteria bacterium]|nr:amino-acid N-acetyltransferase [Gammaproteobacteria bacterium]
MNEQTNFVRGFRSSAPYIHAYRGRVFVVQFDGDALLEPQFSALVHDMALLHSLGVKLVVVHGIRPQIEERLSLRGLETRFVDGVRVTGADALTAVVEAAGAVRTEVEALLSMGLANSPMHGAGIRVASGNFVTARPVGVRDGVDFAFTGEVRRVDTQAIDRHLDDGSIVLVSPLGYSPSGEVFNMRAEDVATEIALELRAQKLLLLRTGPWLASAADALPRQLSLSDARQALGHKPPADSAGDDFAREFLAHAVRACVNGVARTHLLDYHVDGVLLLELFTRDGHGTLITAEAYEDLREADIDDVAGILGLIKPLEDEGILVKRSRERLEMEINNFFVTERDGTIIACAALYPCEKQTLAELACLAIHAEYQNTGRGNALLQAIETRALQAGIKKLVVLTTRTAHWFRENGFLPGDKSHLPGRKKALYNYQRNSKVYYKLLE